MKHLSTHPTRGEQLTRMKAVMVLRDAGKTYRAIGTELGLSKARIYQLVSQAERSRKWWPLAWNSA